MTIPTALQPSLFDSIRATVKTGEAMPDWLREQLQRQGVLSITGINRRAQARSCTCGAQILAGLDATIAALQVFVDPIPLSPLGEAMALLEGRRAVSLNREGGTWVLNDRYDLQIEGWPAGTKRGEDVLREHRCGSSPLTQPLMADSTHHQAHAQHLTPGSPAPF
ncbi:hypothetical protein [Nocardioides jensenii]|uniref:hypothetical protein n=1 Tax=Nocardioides jensenii TaxID=1843 RepID=UPI00083495C7|nr:hypothetical protein [Nocardioides jensenii]